MSLNKGDKGINSMEPGITANSDADAVIAHTCAKCGGVLEVNEVGFFKPREIVVAYFLGAILIIGNYWLMFFSGADKRISSGDWKAMFLVPAFTFFILNKMRRNVRRKVHKCTKCMNEFDTKC